MANVDMGFSDVVIVGGGHAGAQAAITLRQEKFAGTITIIGEERNPPYERPPLSKEYFSGDKPFERILIRPESFWSDRHIAMMLGHRVVAVDPIARHVVLEDGGLVRYGDLIWAAGGHARRLECAGHHLAGIHTVRSRPQVDAILAELPLVRDVVIIGGGYIGLEAAAVLSKFGKKIVVLEAQDRVLARVAGPPLSTFYQDEHRSHGIDIRLGAAVDCIEGDDRVRHVRLADGTLVPTDLVIAGIGIVPAVTPLLEAGAAGGNGVAVDRWCRTTLPHVYAVGDCALHDNPYAIAGPIRLESVQNASDQAMVAAKRIAGGDRHYDAIPWFWSNQYDLRLQTIGLSTGYDEIVVRGNISSRAFSLAYLRAGRLIALDCVNVTRDYVQGKALIQAGAMPNRAALADPGIALKTLATL